GGGGGHHGPPPGTGAAGLKEGRGPGTKKEPGGRTGEKNGRRAGPKKLKKGAPKKAPPGLPSPPMTTTTNARISASTPMPSTAACAGTTTAPPRPAMKQPSANAWT